MDGTALKTDYIYIFPTSVEKPNSLIIIACIIWNVNLLMQIYIYGTV